MKYIKVLASRSNLRNYDVSLQVLIKHLKQRAGRKWRQEHNIIGNKSKYYNMLPNFGDTTDSKARHS